MMFFRSIYLSLLLLYLVIYCKILTIKIFWSNHIWQVFKDVLFALYFSNICQQFAVSISCSALPYLFAAIHILFLSELFIL